MSIREFDVAIHHGRVIDPGSQLDAIRHIGIRGSTIKAVSETPLAGKMVIDASGLVVAPGCIDLDSHSQSIPDDYLLAYDGVTTVLGLESGILPVGLWYDRQAKSGRALNYGTAVAWIYARVAELNPELGEPYATLSYLRKAFGVQEWSTLVATPGQVERMLARIEQGLQEGGIGISVNDEYKSAAGVQEMAAVAALADQYDVPTFYYRHDQTGTQPCSAGKFARLIARCVQNFEELSLLEAVEKCSLIPAQILEKITPSMIRKGRLQVGADADVIVFDLEKVANRTSFERPNIRSIGMRYVLVNGMQLISDSELDVMALPGQPVRRAIHPAEWRADPALRRRRRKNDFQLRRLKFTDYE